MIFKRAFVFIFGLACCSALATGDGASDWVLKKNENGIRVYTRPLKGYSYDQARVVNTVHSSLSGIVALLLDTKNYPNWMYGCESVATLKTISPTEFYNYQVTGLPWPLSDRDVVAHFNVTQDPTTKVVTFAKIGDEDFIPEKKGYVRVKNFRSVLTLTPISKDSVRMELEVHLDPGGNIPDWFYNENLVQSPYNTTVGTVNQLPKYQKASLSFIKEY